MTAPSPAGTDITSLDDFHDPAEWLAVTSGLAQLKITRDDSSGSPTMRLDYDFGDGGGFVVARKKFDLRMPEKFSLDMNIRGDAPDNKFEIKLSDHSGQNVWWYHQDAFHFPEGWAPLNISSNDISYAWGPAGGGKISEVGAIELAIAAGPGGKGTVWLSDLRLQDRTYRLTPVVTASSELEGFPAENVLTPDANEQWRSVGHGSAWITVDYLVPRELGGLIVHWVQDLAPTDFDVHLSDDAVNWKRVHDAKQANGDRSYIYLPEARPRFVKFQLQGGCEGDCYGIAQVEVAPVDTVSVPGFFEHISQHERPGLYPKYLRPEQSYWTPISCGDGGPQALMNEDGMVEVEPASLSLEPYLYLDSKLVTWADASVSQKLIEEYLPIPSSVWVTDTLKLVTTAFMSASPEGRVLFVKYGVTNLAEEAVNLKLLVTLRPFQVTPPWQAFRKFGGVSPVSSLAFSEDTVWVNGSKALFPLDKASNRGAATFAQGGIAPWLEDGNLPEAHQVNDERGLASGAWSWDLSLEPQGSQIIHVAAPVGAVDTAKLKKIQTWIEAQSVETLFDEAVTGWRQRLSVVSFDLPPEAHAFAEACRTCLAHILINRDGAALQPGPRRYTRSWIRDGAIMAAALLRMGLTEEARDFVRWYAPFQRDDGFVPCCVDRLGIDWLVEHDSHGQFIYAVMEYYRYTADRVFLDQVWPVVRRAAGYLEGLRQTRLTAVYDTPEKSSRRGLLPESVSHEGYLSQPVHSYWDDFWAIRGFGDGADIADQLGKAEDATKWRSMEVAMREDVRKSIALTMKDRNIDIIPGSVEWADFDPTATANAVGLLGELTCFPPEGLQHSFEVYLEGWRKRKSGATNWMNYTAYEIRIIGALVRLGRRQEAYELGQFFLVDRRPQPWNQWPEISWRNPRSPGHLGDLPHSWISAEYVIAFHTMLAYVREEDQALVVAAGVPEEWLAGDRGITFENLPTPFGALSYSLLREGNGIRFSLTSDLAPPGGIVVQPPLSAPLVKVEGDLANVAAQDSASVTLRRGPVEVVLRC